MSNYNQSMFDFIKVFLKENRPEWTYEIVEDQEDSKVIIFGIQGNHGIQFHVVIDVREARKIMLVYSIFSINVPESKFTVISELINRLNYGLIIGNFEFDFSDGEIRFKTSAQYEDIIPTYSYVDRLIISSITTLDKASKIFSEVILDELSSEEAYKLFRN